MGFFIGFGFGFGIGFETFVGRDHVRPSGPGLVIWCLVGGNFGDWDFFFSSFFLEKIKETMMSMDTNMNMNANKNGDLRGLVSGSAFAFLLFLFFFLCSIAILVLLGFLIWWLLLLFRHRKGQGQDQGQRQRRRSRGGVDDDDDEDHENINSTTSSSPKKIPSFDLGPLPPLPPSPSDSLSPRSESPPSPGREREREWEWEWELGERWSLMLLPRWLRRLFFSPPPRRIDYDTFKSGSSESMAARSGRAARHYWNPARAFFAFAFARGSVAGRRRDEGDERVGLKLEDLGRNRTRKKEKEEEEVKWRNSFDWSSDEEGEMTGFKEEEEGSEGSEKSELGLGKYFWESGVGIREW